MYEHYNVSDNENGQGQFNGQYSGQYNQFNDQLSGAASADALGGNGGKHRKHPKAGRLVRAALAVGLVFAVGVGSGYGVSYLAKTNASQAQAQLTTGDQTAKLNESASQNNGGDQNGSQQDAAGTQADANADQQNADNANKSENALADNNTKTQLQTTSTTTSANTTVIDVSDIVENAMPSIVSISSNVTQQVQTVFGTQTQEGTAAGSGVIVAQTDTELLILTNNHVVADSNALSVQFTDGKEATANIKGTDSDLDLAVIAVSLDAIESDTMNNIKIATVGDSDSLKVGQAVIAIGNALGYGQSVTTGVVSALNREIETESGKKNQFIQTDAAINPGNSGGALLNSNGELVGINSSKIASDTVEGMGFAIPITSVKDIIENLMNQETKIAVDDADKGVLGVKVGTPTGIEGAVIGYVESGSAADEAGLQEGDIITSLNGTQITSADDLISNMKYCAAGDTVTIKVLRRTNGSYGETEIQVTLGAQSAEQEQNSSNSQNGQQSQNGQNSQNGEEFQGGQNPFGGSSDNGQQSNPFSGFGF